MRIHYTIEDITGSHSFSSNLPINSSLNVAYLYLIHVKGSDKNSDKI